MSIEFYLVFFSFESFSDLFALITFKLIGSYGKHSNNRQLLTVIDRFANPAIAKRGYFVIIINNFFPFTNITKSSWIHLWIVISLLWSLPKAVGWFKPRKIVMHTCMQMGQVCMQMGQVFEQLRKTSVVELSLIKVAALQSQLTQI